MIDEIRTYIALFKQPIAIGSEDFKSGYLGLVQSLGVTVVSWYDIGSYQGDQFMLLRLGKYWGFLVTGFGSCSGCDAYEACGDKPIELEILRNELADRIIWKESAHDMMRFIDVTHDWEGSYYHDSKYAKQQAESFFTPFLMRSIRKGES